MSERLVKKKERLKLDGWVEGGRGVEGESWGGGGWGGGEPHRSSFSLRSAKNARQHLWVKLSERLVKKKDKLDGWVEGVCVGGWGGAWRGGGGMRSLASLRSAKNVRQHL